MTVCEMIDAILKEKNMSRRQLAIAAGIPPSSLQSALSRNNGLSLDMLLPISDVLDIDVPELDTGKKFPGWCADIEKVVNESLDPKEVRAQEILYALNDAGKDKWIEYGEDLLEMPKYREIDPFLDE